MSESSSVDQDAISPEDARHAQLEDELRAQAARIDPVPAHVFSAARGSFTWRTVDAELAELAFDSVLELESAALVRSGEQPRLLTFEAPDLTIEVEVINAGEERRIVGQLVPPSGGALTIRSERESRSLQVDELGRFRASGVAPGPLSLRWEGSGDGPAVETEWTLV